MGNLILGGQGQAQNRSFMGGPDQRLGGKSEGGSLQPQMQGADLGLLANCPSTCSYQILNKLCRRGRECLHQKRVGRRPSSVIGQCAFWFQQLGAGAHPPAAWCACIKHLAQKWHLRRPFKYCAEGCRHFIAMLACICIHVRQSRLMSNEASLHVTVIAILRQGSKTSTTATQTWRATRQTKHQPAMANVDSEDEEEVAPAQFTVC